MEINLVGVKTVANFEVISIMDEKDPYPALLGIYWAFDNSVIINLKRETMTFEVDGTRLVRPLDPYQGTLYTEPSEDALEDTMLY
jgi:hypothetical protein